MKTRYNIRCILIFITLVFVCSQRVAAFSFNLDSIAQMGKFPRFVVNTYHWGDGFFNGYNQEFVKPTGYKFNIKTKVDNWLDTYSFVLTDDVRMHMVSEPCSSLGFWLTYMAVSVGYDINLSKYFTGNSNNRKRFDFQFNCSLFAAELYLISNDVGTTITRFGTGDDSYRVDIPFYGINTRTLTLDAYYFFNHKKYSHAAAFSFSREQVKSAGSLFAGFSYFDQRYSFDFSSLPYDMKQYLPASWNSQYSVNAKNYGIKLGYGYNWVVGRNWVLCLSEAPTIGVKRGFINVKSSEKWSFSLYNTLRMSAVWSNGRLFAGILGRVETALFYDKEHTLFSNMVDLEISAGYRFNLW
ncbi:MAG: DUF4421 domain-containing protein [Muribaculaceae bacterium]|nr:DUF4421 domain-containing protein [Muribaculaceae bacterium]